MVTKGTGNGLDDLSLGEGLVQEAGCPRLGSTLGGPRGGEGRHENHGNLWREPADRFQKRVSVPGVHADVGQHKGGSLPVEHLQGCFDAARSDHRETVLPELLSNNVKNHRVVIDYKDAHI